LAPSECHLIATLKEFFGRRRLISIEEVLDAINQWLNGLTANVYDKGKQKFVTRYDKCLNVNGDYVENKWGVCNNDTLNF
jgi:hypothetical protein